MTKTDALNWINTMKRKPAYSIVALIVSLGTAAWVQAASTLQFTATTYTVAENAGAVTLTVQRLGDTNTEVSVDYATADGTATNGFKYTAVSATLAFAAGQTNQVIVVPILNEGLVEGTKSFRVVLTNAVGDAVLGTRSSATVSILDNDIGVQFEFAGYSAAENAGSVLIGVSRGDDGNFPVSVDFATSDGTATNGVGYTATNGTLAFAAGDKIRLFTVPILNDGLKEGNKYFRLSLSNAINQVLGPLKTATVWILDNDPGVQFEFNQYWVQESEVARTVKVFRGNDMALDPFTVDYATADLRATNGVDYTAANGTLAFAQAECLKTITVPILCNGPVQQDRQFKLTLSNPSGGATLGPNATATVTILDATGMAPHRFDAIALQPDGSVQLTLGGAVSRRFQDYFDLYPIEVSSNLVDWIPWVTLQRTNASKAALTYTDRVMTNLAARFYRTPATNLITPFFLKPAGPFPVGVVSRLLTDPTRRNRYGVSTNGSFMVSAWYPAVAQAGRLPALFEHPQLAQDPTVPAASWVAFMDRMPYLVTYALPDLPCATDHAPYPIVLYSTGSTGDHADASERGPYLASYGYVVVGLEHYDCFATVFPDGTQLRGPSDVSTEGLQDRVRDMVFALDELTRWNSNDPVFAGRLDLTKVAAMGISYGGGTVAEFGRTENRCKAVIALDPGLVQGVPQLGVPLLEITTPEVGDTGLYSLASREAIWFQLNGAAHVQGGSDFYWAFLPDPAELAFSREAARTMIAYELWFLNKQLKGEVGPPLPLGGFPLVLGFKQK
jgi:hypothetical protein